ncbi:MAG: AAA family ATPase [Candidatus Rokuibacteriota bacterium]
MRCPNCGTELPESAKFCLECGQPLSRAAAAPAAYASPATYTPKHLADKILTTRAAMEGERKQVTVLFCDLANSTPLAERLGPERMHALLSSFFELALAEVHRYEGTINQFLGDGLMALFGAPIAHEDDARRAVMAAVAIRRMLRDRGSYFGAGSDLTVRMGLNTGLVVVGSIGDNLRMDYTAVGDTTNVAARLQGSAEPGEILVSETTARLVRGDARLTPAGALQVKGRSEPVVAYKLLGLAPRRSALERAEERVFGEFVGRERELRLLGEALAEVQAGRGRLVSLVGEAGAGKSRLLYEFRKSLGSLDVAVVEERCRSYGTTTPYLPIMDGIRSLCGLGEGDAPADMARKIGATLEDLGLDPGERAPYLMALLGLKEGVGLLEALSPETVKANTVDTLRRVLTAASARRPLLMIIEDLHWIDAPSEEYVASMIDVLAEAPILLLLTYRPDYAPRWAPAGCALTMTIERLSDAESRALVRSMAQRGSLGDDAIHAILAKADGNPLFLEELARAVLDGPAGAAAPAVPDSLRGVLTARMDRLPEATKRLLQTAAVLGRDVPARLLEAVSEDGASVTARLADLARLDYMHERGSGEEAAYVFNHALAQEAAYESLLTQHRETLHDAAAQALETMYAGRLDQALDRIAWHYARTQRHEKAVEYLGRTAARAMRAYANTEALRALEEAEAHARRLPDDGERVRLGLVLLRAEALFTAGRFQEDRALLLAETEAFERQGESSLAADWHFRLAGVHGVLGEGALAAEHAHRSIEIATACGDRATLGRAHFVLGREKFWSGSFRDAVAQLREAVKLLSRPTERFWSGLSHWMMGLVYTMRGDFDAALDAAAMGQAAAEALGDRRLMSNIAWARSWVYSARGEFAAAVLAAERALELAPDEVSRAFSRAWLGIAHVERGDYTAALPLLDAATQTVAAMKFIQLEAWFTIFGGLARLGTGDVDGAAASAARGLEVATGARFWPAISAAYRLLAGIARAGGDLDAAAAHLEESLLLIRVGEARFEEGRTLLGLAELAQQRGDHATASTRAEAAREIFEEVRVPYWVDTARALAVSAV